MTPESAPAKRELRQQIRAALRSIPAADAQAASVAACERLRQQSIWKNARSVLFYSWLPGEVDLSALLNEGLRSGKTIALPRFMDDTGVYNAFQIGDFTQDCARGKFGITEPAKHCTPFPLNQLDLTLAPGVAFDPTGHRLGRGQGFYDRLLAQINGAKCGVAFDRQIVGRIPAEEHDVRVNYILTPTRWLEIAN